MAPSLSRESSFQSGERLAFLATPGLQPTLVLHRREAPKQNISTAYRDPPARYGKAGARGGGRRLSRNASRRSVRRQDPRVRGGPGADSRAAPRAPVSDGAAVMLERARRSRCRGQVRREAVLRGAARLVATHGTPREVPSNGGQREAGGRRGRSVREHAAAAVWGAAPLCSCRLVFAIRRHDLRSWLRVTLSRWRDRRTACSSTGLERLA